MTYSKTRELTDKEGRMVINLYLEKSGNAIAKELDLDRNAVYKFLQDHGLTRNKKDAAQLNANNRLEYNRSGDKNPNWKGGQKIVKGYRHFYLPHHPDSIKNYYPEHRLVMEIKLGRILTKKEKVHHIDGNPLNNDIDNLRLFPSQNAHAKYHIKIRRTKKNVKWN